MFPHLRIIIVQQSISPATNYYYSATEYFPSYELLWCNKIFPQLRIIIIVQQNISLVKYIRIIIVQQNISSATNYDHSATKYFLSYELLL